jgi:molecular chaperone HtpG
MSGHMQRILQAAGQAAPEVKPILELNPKHPLILRLCQEQDDAQFNDWSLLLLEQAQLNEGTSLRNPAEFVQRMNKLLLSV